MRRRKKASALRVLCEVVGHDPSPVDEDGNRTCTVCGDDLPGSEDSK